MTSVNMAIKRLSQEKKKLDESRVCDFYIIPLEDNIFEWHFTIKGPSDSPYEGGLYHGILRFSRNYPFSPPDIVFLTQNGRFEIGVDICSSISSYHPENWRPTYDIELILTALRSFMAQEEERGIGSLIKKYVNNEEKRQLAKDSHNFSCIKCGMKSALDVWETKMKQYPSALTSTVTGVNVSDGSNNNSDKKEKKENKNVKLIEDVEVEKEKFVEKNDNVTNFITEEVKNTDKLDNNNNNCGDSVNNSLYPRGTLIQCGETDITRVDQGDKLTTEEDKHCEITEEKKEEKGKTENNLVAELESSSSYIRISLNRFSLRIDVKYIDRAIFCCFFVCVAILFKKWMW